jgi:membrane protease YdiL (CAAX protease family)
VHLNGAVIEAPLPAARAGMRVWPARVVWTCIGWMFVFSVIGLVAYAMAAVVTDDEVLRTAVTLPFQYTGMYVAMRRISRRYGTGDVVEDITWRVRRSDVWPGVAVGFIALIVTAIGANAARALLGLEAGDTDQFGIVTDSTSGKVLVFILAVVFAPIFEEALFRGVILHALLRRGAWFGVAMSSMLFASSHLTGGFTARENALIFCSTFFTGAVLALGVLRLDRLGPSMVAHSLFNLLVVWATFTVT